MNDKRAEEIRQFQDCVFYPQERPLDLDVKKGVHPFVTISRQAGAGGHTLAQALLVQMDKEKDPLFQGWRMFDHELCMKILRDSNLKVPLESLLKEEYQTQIEEILLGLMTDESPQETVIKKTFETIRALATFGKVILVGRAGSCVTEGLPSGVHVRLAAPEPNRLRRMADLLHLSSEKAVRKALNKQDQDRARLVKDYFNKNIDDPLLYDTVWNTGRVPMETIASCIIAVVRQRVSSVQAGSVPVQTSLH